MRRLILFAMGALTALSLVSCSSPLIRTPEPAQEEIVGRWEYSEEDSTWGAPGAYIEFSADGTFVSVMPEFPSTTGEASRSADSELISEHGTWNIAEGKYGQGWAVDYVDSTHFGSFAVVDAGADRRLETSVGWVEDPDRFVLRKVD